MSRILVVDDEPDMRLLLRAFLERRGWDVTEAASGEEAIDACRGADFDAVVLDQRMGGATGIETARRLLDLGIGRPVAVFSAYLDAEVEAEASEIGIAAIAKSDIGRLLDLLPPVS